MHPWATLRGTVAVLGSFVVTFETHGARRSKSLKKEVSRREKVLSFESHSDTFPLESKVCVGVCLHVVLLFFFSGFEDCLDLDPLAPVQS